METFVKETMVLPTQHEKTGIRVDFIFSYTPFENNAIKRARVVNILGQKVAFATPEDLIIHKVFAGRPRDLEDVRIVLLKNSDIDVQYIRKWLREFDESSNNDAFLENFENILKDII
jgi:predicted nucleotidyltransferase